MADDGPTQTELGVRQEIWNGLIPVCVYLAKNEATGIFFFLFFFCFVLILDFLFLFCVLCFLVVFDFGFVDLAAFIFCFVLFCLSLYFFVSLDKFSLIYVIFFHFLPIHSLFNI